MACIKRFSHNETTLQDLYNMWLKNRFAGRCLVEKVEEFFFTRVGYHRGEGFVFQILGTYCGMLVCAVYGHDHPDETRLFNLRELGNYKVIRGNFKLTLEEVV